MVASLSRMTIPPRPTFTSSLGPGTPPQLHLLASVQLPVVLFGQVQVAVGAAAIVERDSRLMKIAKINSTPHSAERFKAMLPPLEVELSLRESRAVSS